MTYDEAVNFVDSVKAMREEVPDALALKCKGAYPYFKSLCKKQFVAKKAGFKFQYQGDLYKTIQPNIAFVEHYKPGVGTESMFARIDETHAGTKEDPIPYNDNMALENGKYYSQDGVIYRCTRDTGNPVYNALKELVGLYVKLVK